MKGSPLSGRASSSASVGSDVQVCADLWAVTSSWLHGQGLGNNIIGKLVTKIWEEIYGFIFLNG